MRWTAAATRTLALLAPSLTGRVGLHLARYRGEGGCSTPGRGTITVDGAEVAAFGTAEYWLAHDAERKARQRTGASFNDAYDGARDALHTRGLLGFWDFEQAVETYPDLPIAAALASPDPIIRALAMLDRRVGRRRLAALADVNDLPFVRELYDRRCAAEALGG
jgi:hypothetical protein